MSIETNLTQAQIDDLRRRGLIESKETAFLAGDIVVALDPVTSTKRHLGSASVLLTESSNKRVLKG